MSKKKLTKEDKIRLIVKLVFIFTKGYTPNDTSFSTADFDFAKYEVLPLLESLGL